MSEIILAAEQSVEAAPASIHWCWVLVSGFVGFLVGSGLVALLAANRLPEAHDCDRYWPGQLRTNDLVCGCILKILRILERNAGKEPTESTE